MNKINPSKILAIVGIGIAAAAAPVAAGKQNKQLKGEVKGSSPLAAIRNFVKKHKMFGGVHKENVSSLITGNPSSGKWNFEVLGHQNNEQFRRNGTLKEKSGHKTQNNDAREFVITIQP